jgi:hypothetical protein
VEFDRLDVTCEAAEIRAFPIAFASGDRRRAGGIAARRADVQRLFM